VNCWNSCVVAELRESEEPETVAGTVAGTAAGLEAVTEAGLEAVTVAGLEVDTEPETGEFRHPPFLLISAEPSIMLVA
jgi:hypothetical protein